MFFEALERLPTHPNKSVRLNPRVLGARELAESMGVQFSHPVSWCEGGYYFDRDSLIKPQTNPLIGAGVLYIQEASAMEPVSMLDVQPGMQVLDLCAAPGGKSSQILDRLWSQGRPTGSLVACEVNGTRVRKLDAMLARWGGEGVSVVSPPIAASRETLPAVFDRVLVDAPCGSESFFSKRKDTRNDLSDRETLRNQKIQVGLVHQGVDSLRAGGILIYSTCTYSRQENEDVVNRVLSERDDVVKVMEQRRWPHRDGVPGGYWAKLAKKTSFSSDLGASSTDDWILARSAKRLHRESNDYADLMKNKSQSARFEPAMELSDRDATLFLQRQWSGNLTERTAMYWRQLPLGFFRPKKGIHSFEFPSEI